MPTIFIICGIGSGIIASAFLYGVWTEGPMDPEETILMWSSLISEYTVAVLWFLSAWFFRNKVLNDLRLYGSNRPYSLFTLPFYLKLALVGIPWTVCFSSLNRAATYYFADDLVWVNYWVVFFIAYTIFVGAIVHFFMSARK